jgi:hypothetical protein
VPHLRGVTLIKGQVVPDGVRFYHNNGTSTDRVTITLAGKPEFAALVAAHNAERFAALEIEMAALPSESCAVDWQNDPKFGFAEG